MGSICEGAEKKNNDPQKKSLLQSYNKSPHNPIYEIKEILNFTSSQNSQTFCMDSNHIKEPKSKSILDFNVVQVLGKGSFGKVLLVQDNTSSKFYAMKILEKNSIKTKQEKINAMSERVILESMDHPFIVKLHYAFQNDKKLYLLVDFMSGGELFYLLRRSKKFQEDVVKFYAGEILLALEYLHSRNIIYRDLKPQNILLDQEGHLKITDFGLSKVCHGKNQVTYSMCGTPQYIAPQVLEGKGYSQSADWFSFGSVIYDMLTGRPPFYSKNKEQMLRNLRINEIPIPQYLSSKAKNLLKGLFQLNVNKRLGSKNGASEVKSHPFFQNIDFDMLYKKKIKTPFKFSQGVNTYGFDANLIKNIPIDSLNEDKLLQDNNFEGFTYQKSPVNEEIIQQNIVSSQSYIIEIEPQPEK